jgi:drug/metabolite transporter (DMT)-like permease
MKNIYAHYQGYIYALCSAICSGTIGVFSVKAIHAGLPPMAIAFYRCIFAFVILTSWFVISGQVKQWVIYLRKFYLKIIFCAFFGLFIVYTFETHAYQYANVPVVVFLLLGSSTLSSFILSSILHKHRPRIYEIVSCVLAICGLIFVFGLNNLQAFKINLIGAALAILAGIGYGGFLAFSNKLRIGTGLMVVNSLALLGAIYLFPGFIHSGAILPSTYSLPFLLALVVVPTIGGFWFTTRALTVIKTSTVQLIELSEPLFAVTLAFVVLHQKLSFSEFLGGLFILGAIIINYFGTNYRILIQKKYSPIIALEKN